MNNLLKNGQNDEECRPYMASIKNIVEIAPEEWDNLLADILCGSREFADRARSRLITGCLPMVARLATQYDNLESQGVKRIDLIGAGNLMLADVVNRLTDDPGVALEAYLVMWVKKAIRQACNQYLGFGRGNDTMDQPEESLDRLLGDSVEDGSPVELIADEGSTDRELIHRSARDELRSVFRSILSGEDPDILYELYLAPKPLTIAQYAKAHGICRQAAYKRNDNAICKVRESDQAERVRELLLEIVDGDDWRNTSDAYEAKNLNKQGTRMDD